MPTSTLLSLGDDGDCSPNAFMTEVVSSILTPADGSLVSVYSTTAFGDRWNEQSPKYVTIRSLQGLFLSLHFVPSKIDFSSAASSPIKTRPKAAEGQSVFNLVTKQGTGIHVHSLTRGTSNISTPVALTMNFSQGLKLTVTSYGLVTLVFPMVRSSSKVVLEHVESAESSRMFLTDHVVRNFVSGLYSRDVTYSSGCRQLFYRSNAALERKKETSKRPKTFHGKLLKAIGEERSCESVLLHPDGSVGVIYADNPSIEVPLECWSIVEMSIDACTKTRVGIYEDGRLVTFFTDGSIESIHPNGIRTIFNHATQTIVYLNSHPHSPRPLPTLEFDLKIHQAAKDHMKDASSIPLNQCRNGARVRISSPFDESAVFIKYNSRIEASFRGSITVITNDRSKLVASDDGKIMYSPSSSWSSKDDEDFKMDCSPSSSSSFSSSPSSSTLASDNSSGAAFKKSEYVFDLRSHIALVRDQDFNTFTIRLAAKSLTSTPNGHSIKMDLAGEVEGMAAEAVFAPPLPPLGFVIRRPLNEVTQILSHCELDPSLQPYPESAFKRLQWIESSGYSFADIFGPRDWFSAKPCAALSNALRLHPSFSSLSSSPASSFEVWASFNLSAYELPTVDQIQRARDRLSSLKLSSRIVPVEFINDNSASNLDENESDRNSSKDTIGERHTGKLDNKAEEEDPEGSHNDDDDDDDDEISAAFSSFSVKGITGRRIECIFALRAALIQICNAYIPDTYLEEAMERACLKSKKEGCCNEISLDKEDFTNILERLQRLKASPGDNDKQDSSSSAQEEKIEKDSEEILILRMDGALSLSTVESKSPDRGSLKKAKIKGSVSGAGLNAARFQRSRNN